MSAHLNTIGDDQLQVLRIKYATQIKGQDTVIRLEDTLCILKVIKYPMSFLYMIKWVGAHLPKDLND